MKNALAQLIVETERVKKMSWMAQAAALPPLIAMFLNLLGKMIDEINALKKGRSDA